MFTRLIQALGSIHRQTDYEIQVIYQTDASAIHADIALGDSIAVDGICLSVTEILDDGFVAAVSPETLRRTTLEGQLSRGYVNLEASLRVGSKVGGHFVSGHVDGVGRLVASHATATSWEMTFQVADLAIARYIVSKGSIAINGISLTIATCNPSGSEFTVAVIPLTYAETNLSRLQPGDRVNLEGDILGKYVEKFLRLDATSPTPAAIANPASLSSSFLAEHGYL